MNPVNTDGENVGGRSRRYEGATYEDTRGGRDGRTEPTHDIGLPEALTIIALEILDTRAVALLDELTDAETERIQVHWKRAFSKTLRRYGIRLNNRETLLPGDPGKRNRPL